MTERFPDIEIYLMKPDPAAVRGWLASALGELRDQRVLPDHHHWVAECEGKSVDIFLNEKAEKNFASLWIKQNHTIWNTDLDCARSAHKALSVEIRCSDSGWEEADGESDQGWVKLIRGEEKPFEWS
ncbi:hypothetical protein ACQUQU_00410 [Thalassolituus sp. LLYu03]|uniref:hypothetical protein n=1 Tax=Thalassolituus sp. LLYu03 TaxID=3421656 RepID=UPI003D2A5388